MAETADRIDWKSSFGSTPMVHSSPPSSSLPSPTHRPQDLFTALRGYDDRLHDPAASMLDLDDDPRVHDDPFDDEAEDSPSRISYLGPKMHFHSRAPWEVDPGDAQAVPNPSRVTLFSKAFSLSSSRSSNASRPSVDSASSQTKSKQSFETTSSHTSNAFYTLAQESLSKRSLHTFPAEERKSFSVRSDSDSHSFPPSPISDSSLSNNMLTAQRNARSTLKSLSSHRQSTSPSDNFHPYANPDLVISVSDDRSVSSSSFISCSDSAGTVTESIQPIQESNTTTALKTRTLNLHGKEISSPLSAMDTSNYQSHRAKAVPSLSADKSSNWPKRTTSAGFSLISLEEAQAKRARSVTTQSSARLSESTSPTSVEFPHSPEDSDYRLTDRSAGPHSLSVRGRSTSAGSKAKSALHSIVHPKSEHREPDLVSAPKTLKSKRSGFLRLFNGGRGQEKDEQVPSVPPLADAFTALNKGPINTTSRNLDLGTSSLTQRTATLDSSPNLQLPSTLKRSGPLLSINTFPRALSEDESSQQSHLNNYAPKSAPANVSEFPALKLRPVSTVFSAHFSDILMNQDSRPSWETDVGTPDSSTNILSPVTPGSATRSNHPNYHGETPLLPPQDQSYILSSAEDKMLNEKPVWQRRIWELEREVRDLRAEISQLRTRDHKEGFCQACGRGSTPVTLNKRNL